jgi:hypothetical protein
MRIRNGGFANLLIKSCAATYLFQERFENSSYFAIADSHQHLRNILCFTTAVFSISSS